MMSFIIRDKIDFKFILKSILYIFIMIILIIIGKTMFKIENDDVLIDTDSQYSRIWIKKMNSEKATYKTIHVAGGIESYVNIDTGEMGAEYLQYYDLFNYYNKNANSTLMIGGAAYTYPTHYFKKFTNKTMDVVEIDKKMTKIAEKEFELDVSNPNLKIYHQDGRSFLNYRKEKYDTILIDAFKGLVAPFELTTYEAMQKAKEMLNDDGMVITNIISSIEGKNSKFIKYEYETYKKVFDDVKVYQVRKIKNDKNQNLILVGIKGKPTINDNFESYKKYLDNDITYLIHDGKVVTDDYAPIGN